jgi:hypothetical protein
VGNAVEGRVFLASNARNEVIAIKITEPNVRTADWVNAESARHQEVTELAKNGDDSLRVVCLKETIYPGGEEKYSSGSMFDEVALVLAPIAPQTLNNIVGNGHNGYLRYWGKTGNGRDF